MPLHHVNVGCDAMQGRSQDVAVGFRSGATTTASSQNLDVESNSSGGDWLPR
jgi:hypothetical protein